MPEGDVTIKATFKDKKNPDPTPDPDKPDKPDKPGTRTGDESQLLLWLLAMVVSAVGALLTVVLDRK